MASCETFGSETPLFAQNLKGLPHYQDLLSAKRNGILSTEHCGNPFLGVAVMSQPTQNGN